MITAGHGARWSRLLVTSPAAGRKRAHAANSLARTRLSWRLPAQTRGRKREEEGGREGGKNMREGGKIMREGWMDGWMEGGREGGREVGREGGRKRGELSLSFPSSHNPPPSRSLFLYPPRPPLPHFLLARVRGREKGEKGGRKEGARERGSEGGREGGRDRRRDGASERASEREGERSSLHPPSPPLSLSLRGRVDRFCTINIMLSSSLCDQHCATVNIVRTPSSSS